MVHKYTQEQTDFLIENVIGRGTAELTELFNAYFGLELKRSQIKGFKANRGLNSGLTGRFEKGSIPVNKGTKGLYNVGGNCTSFKPGQKAPNYKPVGSERLDRDGYILIKVSDVGTCPERWKLKHKVLWEEANGPVPKGHCLIFLDSNKHNTSLDNLQLITRTQLARMNQNDLISNDPELTKTGLIVADIITKISERKRNK
jgi:hypothetical protein